MLYINTQDRDDIEHFRMFIYNYIKEHKLKYSDQRERVLKMLYSQKYPITTDLLVNKLNERSTQIGYATVSRHLRFFTKLNMLLVVNRTQKSFLLKKSMGCDTNSKEELKTNYQDVN